ncbi:Transketolase 1 [Smittium mucronatum]|uniref:Transketolase n=1 Tax=Smittium mucronatum TaxID=133383 RepID=A0A1R0GL78_9FUNG|nr:Transketolase 1 [Smittium mucronatum]
MASVFTATDIDAVNTIRCLAADTVQGANSGHPGAPMGCAPMAHILYSKFMTGNPKNPHWINRDRFVLSNGHACALQYVTLHLMGYDISMDDLKHFRQLHSITPGHPERMETPGIEVTTGPLGQGISNAVGLAIAERHLAATFNTDDFKVIDNTVYCIVGDGCLQEGVSSEASSIAGHLQLGNLIVLYDSNHIQIDGSTELAFTENVLERYEAYGWHTLYVENGDSDFDAIYRAIEEAKKVTDKPSIIRVHTTIGFGSAKQGTEKVHGAPLGDADIAHVKSLFHLDPTKKYFVEPEIYDFYAKVAAHGAQKEAEWNAMMARYKEANPEMYEEFDRRVYRNELPSNIADLLPRYTPSDPAVATRKLSETVINAIAPSLPEFIGGSADLTGSNLTHWKGAVDFQPAVLGIGNYSGRYLRYGVREHAMAAISNGMAAYGGLIPFASTFLNFISYAVGASRLTALQKLRVLYIMTHDSIGLGEDGPTHQPIETLSMLRATPNTIVIRPADGNETSAAYLSALTFTDRPSVFCLTRQNLSQLVGSSIESAMKGGYILQDVPNPSLILIGTGSEVEICVKTAQILIAEGIQTRVVSMPSTDIFDLQSSEYRHQVLPKGVPIISVEAMSTEPWYKYAHHPIGIDTFGASGKINDLYNYFGLTPEKIAVKARKVIEFYKSNPVPVIERLW